MASVSEGTLLWQPSAAAQQQSRMMAYMHWLHAQQGLHFTDYAQLWEWSVTEVEAFWESIWHYFEVQSSQPYTSVLVERVMPGAQWFPGARLNYAEHVFRHATDTHPALIFLAEHQPLTEISWAELRQHVAAVTGALRGLGVGEGDRVVAYIPNIPEALYIFLACASVGAIWSSCSPDFGSPSVIDRFKQIEPKVLFAIDGYPYGGKGFERRDVVATLREELPTLQQTVLIPYLNKDATLEGADDTVMLWGDFLATGAGHELTFAQVPFDQPLWVLYSSGTTGLPKPIVQGHGGILLEHIKSHALHFDVRPGDRFFWFTTTGWMMWNFLIGSLLVGSTALLYDGSPGHPDMNVLWKFAEQTGMTFFGTSAAYITACMKAKIEPGRDLDLSKLRGMGSTGSPLSPEAFVWVYEHVKPDIALISYSGGTDICTGVVGGAPLLPVYTGEIQCRQLGAKVEAFNEQGQPLIDEMGEFVMTVPMPSMPLFFWNDPHNERYTASYFEMYPGTWRHGDWVKITERGSIIIYGRSDSTINRMGVRMGTSDIYRAVEDLSEVLDSLVIDIDIPGKASYMPLFVVLREGQTLDEGLTRAIKRKIRETLSPRHVPDDIYQISDVPRTLSGKKLEVPIKKIMMGMPIARAANPDAMRNPDVLVYFTNLTEQLRKEGKLE
ncbi:MAG: acetoacetate--CoA ligase [Chloroflexaceae bacterium]|nr:acetoacetate--CoA ligase [Chloroflexaceae bacterium]